ncbi:MAG: exonuclease, partial [Pricia sp.]|nr:exonuclease [Pricia sp.]
TNNGSRARQLQKATKKVTYEKTGSELVALLKENEELNRNRPRFNQKLPSINFSYGVYHIKDQNGYESLKAKKTKNRHGFFAMFNSLEAAENFIARVTLEFQLCDKINGISTDKKHCQKFEDAECQGACISLEDPEHYNMRVYNAISKFSLGDKNVVIIDKGREIGENSAILIKNGDFKGLGFYELNYQINNIHILQSIITPMNASENSTHIIESYLRKRRVLKIMELSN